MSQLIGRKDLHLDGDVDKLLHDLYYNPKNPTAYTSLDKVYRAARKQASSIKRWMWISGSKGSSLQRFTNHRERPLQEIESLLCQLTINGKLIFVICLR